VDSVPPAESGALTGWIAETFVQPRTTSGGASSERAPSMGCAVSSSAACYQIRFEPLRAAMRARVFSCDAHGRVEIDALGESARIDYLFARALVGREFATPALVETTLG
jgi:hypothetical protein